MARGYRWETLRKLRQDACDAAAAALATAAGERARLETARGAARAACEEADARLGAHRGRARPVEGAPFRGVDWHRDQAFERRLAAEVAARRADLATAQARLMEGARREEAARDALVAARQELEVLERDRARVEAEEKKTADRREEAEAEDVAAARWGRP